MTGAEILDAILSDSFPSSKRADALTWANATLGWLWNMEEWSFRSASDTVKVTAGSHDVSELPGDYGKARSLERADGWPLVSIPDRAEFARRYLGTGNESTSLPEAFCASFDEIRVGPKSSETNTGYLLEYERAFPALADDSAEAGIPAEAHLAVVMGGKARGFLLSAPEMARQYYAAADAEVATLRPNYLRAMVGAPARMPADDLC